ncbi:MAG: PolC-type DNA polymerase III [Clostridiales bacterium]|nr:PolC-type DNA polymerase III [Clostridiales bacterium]
MQDVTLHDKRNILSVFPNLEDNAKRSSYLKNVSVRCINVYKKSQKVELVLVSYNLISPTVVYSVQRSLKDMFKDSRIRIKVTYESDFTLEDVLANYWKDILLVLSCNMAIAKAILRNAQYKLVDGKLKIILLTRGADILLSKRCNEMIEKLLKDYFDKSVRVEFCNYVPTEQEKISYIREKESEEYRVVTHSILSSANIASETKPVDNSQRKSENNYRKPKTPSSDIYGKVFNDPLIKIVEITQDSGEIAFNGEVISTEERELQNGKILFMFDMTDYTSSVTCKIFLKKDDLIRIKDHVKEGAVLKVKGDAQYDKYIREVSIYVLGILKGEEKEKRMDNADEKRVELHLHTQMSAMDGVSSASDLIKRVSSWGHKAVAITDHGVVQAFPEAMDAAKKYGIKVIYGVECYLLEDEMPIVVDKQNTTMDTEFVVFDIETTGLDSKKEQIIEIGAVKIKNGQEVDKFSEFIKPTVPIPPFITELTGITDDMVAESLGVEEVLPKFLEFAKGCVLVAHNAPFDLGFVKEFASRLKLSVENSVLDTLMLSRRMFPNLSKHKLNIVAKHLGVSLLNHHRAVDDAMATAGILLKCLDILKKDEIETLEDINNLLQGNVDIKKTRTHHAIILVKNYVGLKNLYKIISESHLKYFYMRPRVPRKLILKYREGLILGSACESGELYRAIVNKKSDLEIEQIAKFYDYLEVQPLGNNRFMLENNIVESKKELEDINKKIIALGKKLGKLVVATCDVHFLDPKDEVYRRILMAGKGFKDADNQAPLYLRTTEEMLAEFYYLDDELANEIVVTNTNKISDMIEDILPIPDGTYPPKIDGAEEEIKELTYSKAHEIYGENLPKIVADRIKKELNSIIKNGFSVMYIIAQKLVWNSLEHGYLVGSRGSVGSSFVANMVGITEVNSLPPHYICTKCKYSEFVEDTKGICGFDLPPKNCPNCGQELKRDGYDIPFETFLGFDGDKEPDIDLNFSGEYQAKAHKYTEVLFGEGNVFKAGTIGTIASKTAFGFVKNYFEERNKIVPQAEMNRLIKGCEGVKRTTGQHPGGIMVVPRYKEIYDFCPIQRPADDVNSDTITTHFDYHSISGRLLKLDILGHDDPTMIRMLEDLTGVDATKIPIGEEKTMTLFRSTEALGITPEDIDSTVGTFAVPEFGTKFVRQMLIDTKPTTFSELIRISGLSHGTDVWLNNAQDLVRNNIATLSEVICTRDDIMLYLLRAGLPPKTSFKIMEDVRKGKGLKKEYEEIMKEKNVPDWYIDSCKKIKYMFPKAHAAAYVMMAFRIAWFKVYYPLAFYIAYYTVRADLFDAVIMIYGKERVQKKIKEYKDMGNKLKMTEKNILTILEVVNEMYARGIEFLPIDIYKSDAEKFLIEDGKIRPPLCTLQGLGKAAAQSIAEARKKGKFLSIDELRSEARLSKPVIDILDQIGALEGMPESNQISLF